MTRKLSQLFHIKFAETVKSQVVKKASFTIFILILIGGGTIIYLWNKPHKKAENVKSINITAAALAKEYRASEENADTKYLNKAIDVSGTISEVDKNQDGGIMIILQTDDPSAGIGCALRDKGANPIKGQNIEIIGFCSGNSITGVSLTDCIIK